MLVTRGTVRKMERKHSDEIAFERKMSAHDRQMVQDLQVELDGVRKSLSEAHGQGLVVVTERDLYKARLKKVADMETPSCANIGRKMARAARGE